MEWVPFHVSWGGIQGADPRRLLAAVCRRGGIEGGDVGAIRVERGFSIVNIASGVAEAFAQAAAAPDPRDPRMLIRRDGSSPARAGTGPDPREMTRRGPEARPPVRTHLRPRGPVAVPHAAKRRPPRQG